MAPSAEKDAWAALESVDDILHSVDINSLTGPEFERMWAMSKIVSKALTARVTPPRSVPPLPEPAR